MNHNIPGTVRLKNKLKLTKKYLIGHVKRHPDGFGFFIPKDSDHADVYIPRSHMGGAMSLDEVEIEVFPEPGGSRFRGHVLKILKRNFKVVVGHFYKKNNGQGFVKDEGHGWGADLLIPPEKTANAKNKDLVAVEILSYPDEKHGFLGQVKQVLGEIEDPLNDIKRIIYAHHIPEDFSKETLKEVSGLKENPEPKDYQYRKNLMELPLITIDGVTAKDFDDAVYCKKKPNGEYHLLVAIADVSHYVKPKTSLDRDAYEKGTSVYFPNYVVPMLPEALSNGLCSLKPNVPRLCVVADLTFDQQGKKIQSRFYEAVMKSHARVTYAQAQDVLDKINNSQDLSDLVTENIFCCADLAKILLKKRFQEGSLDLEIPETELVIDAAGVPIDVIRSERLFAHRLIEELMLAANVAVAEFFDSKKIPAIYRIHEPPPTEALRNLQNYLNVFGGTIKFDEKSGLQKKLSQALLQFSGTPQAQALNILTLRAMSQAKYHSQNTGHFGLGFSHYTHFTSPIRRYPDLIVHRLIKSQILPPGQYAVLPEEELTPAAVFLSACEQRSTKAERQLMAIKKARFAKQFLGKEFDGVISSVTRFGVFVLLKEFDLDGLVRLADLGPSHFEFDEQNLSLVCRKSKLTYSLGDPLKIVVASVDIELGQINFIKQSAKKPTKTNIKDAKPSAKTMAKTMAVKAAKKETPKDTPKYKQIIAQLDEFISKKRSSPGKPKKKGRRK